VTGVDAEENAPLQRVPPQDLAAEQAVLGAMLLDRQACSDLLREVQPGEYYRPVHETVHRAVVAVVAGGGVADPITVAGYLKATGDLTRIGGPGYLHALVEACPSPSAAGHYADLVHDAAFRRGAIVAANALAERGYSGKGDPLDIVESGIEALRAVRDRGMAASDVPPMTLTDFLELDFEEPDWVVPRVLARWDRLILTAGEGGGKSLLLRQLLVRTAAGLHPWRRARIAPQRCLLVDAENSRSQAWPWLRKMADAANEDGAPAGWTDNLVVEIPERPLDLATPGDRAWLLRRAEQVRPDLIAIGPLYKLTTDGKADEEAARPLMTVLEQLRAATDGAALLIEAHAPHEAPGVKRRDLRPLGSSLWRRWPEFGFGLSPVPDSVEMGATAQRLTDWVAWRGARSEREWPEQFVGGSVWPWRAIMPFTGESAPVPAQAAVPDYVEDPEPGEEALWDEEANNV